MKKILLFILLIIISECLFSQEKPSYIALKTGVSFPVGKFSGTSLPDGGFAQTGLSESIEGAWFFIPHFGLVASGGIYIHPVNVRSLGYAKVKSDPFLLDLTIRSDPYKTYLAMIGLVVNFPVIRNLSVAGKAMGGMAFTATPYQLYKPTYYMVESKWYEITSAGDYEGSFLIGAGFNYRLKNCLALSLESDFTYNAMEFDFQTSQGTRTDYKKILFVNLNVGVEVVLGK